MRGGHALLPRRSAAMASDYLPDPDVYDVFDLGMDVASVGPAP